MRTGQKATVTCTQDLGHDRMYWNRHDLGHRLIQYSAGASTSEPGDIPEGYSFSRSNTDYFSLTLESANSSRHVCTSAPAVTPRHCVTACSLCKKTGSHVQAPSTKSPRALGTTCQHCDPGCVTWTGLDLTPGTQRLVSTIRLSLSSASSLDTVRNASSSDKF